MVLLSAFAGRTLTFGKIIAEEVAETRHTESNYRDALLELEKDGMITVVPLADVRPMQAGGLKRTLSAATRITFS